MQAAFVAGRVIVGAFFLFSGFHHFTALPMMSKHLATRGIPLPSLAVALTGLLLLIAGISFLLGWFPKVGVAAAVLFFLPVTLVMHRFWDVADPVARAGQMTNFMKNFAVMGSALMFTAIPEPWPFSLSARRRIRAPAHA